MSNMNLPEWTAQAFVAAGAVFLLISAYWMGVYVPGQKELSDDFESEFFYEGDMTIMDQGQFITLQGDFNAANSLATHNNGHVNYAVTADSSKSNDDETFFHTDVTAYTDTTEAVPIVTLSSSDSYVDRTTYETRANGTDGFAYSTWNPNSLPAQEDTQWPNPFESSWTNTYIFQGVETVSDIETYHYKSTEPEVPYSNANIETLKASFDGFLPAGIEGQSRGYMVYSEDVWVASETGQVVDRDLKVTIMFEPDARLAANFILDETMMSETHYVGNLDGANITATKATVGLEVNAGNDNATNATGNYLTARATLDVFDVEGNSTEMVNSTVVISTNKWTAQIPQADGTYFDVGSTFFSVGSTCALGTNYTFSNPFLATHMNTYNCESATASVIGVDNGLLGTVGSVPAYHFKSVENDIPYGPLDQDENGVADLISLPVFDPVEGYCMNLALCVDDNGTARQWSSLIAYALTLTSLGESALQIPIRSDSTMDLPTLGTAEMVGGGTALLGSQYHPIVQASFQDIDAYAASLGLTNPDGSPISYAQMPFVIDETASAGFTLPQLGGEGCMLGSTFHSLVQGSLAAIPGYQDLCIDVSGSATYPEICGIISACNSEVDLFGQDFHPFFQSGLEAVPGYEMMQFHTEGGMTIPMPGDAACLAAGACVMGSSITHPLVTGILSQVMVGLGEAPSSYEAYPWVLSDNMTLPVPGNLSMFENGTAKLSAQFHPIIQNELAVTATYGVNLSSTPWVLGSQMFLPTLNETGEYIYGLMVGFEGCPTMCYNVTSNSTIAASVGILGNRSTPADPTTWVYEPTCTMGDMDTTNQTCVFGLGIFASFQDAPLSMDSYMPAIDYYLLPKTSVADLPVMLDSKLPLMESSACKYAGGDPNECDLGAALPVIQPQTLNLFMDYEENVWIDPATGSTLDQVYNITVNVVFPWGTKSPAQVINVEYTDAQVMTSTGSRWQTEFGMTYFPGSPVHPAQSDFPIMTLDGGYTANEVTEGVNTVQDTSSALKTGEETVPMVLIGLAMVSLAAGFYVYYQNNQTENLGSGMDESGGEESAPSMATTSDEDSSESESADDDSGGDSSEDDSSSEEE